MPTLLVIDDDETVLDVFRRVFQDANLDVVTAASAESGWQALESVSPDVVVLDVVLPDESGLRVLERIHKRDPKVPILIISATTDSDHTIEAMKLGAFDFLLKPLDFQQVRELVERTLDIRRLMHVPVRLPDAHQTLGGDPLVGRCPAMQDVYKAIGRVAPQNAAVLIRGESGTGKELIARAIYQHSPRSQKQFLAVNCAAIPEALLESELFGHEKGAFTGADSRRIGKFEQCSGGTLFLDEVGDMTPLSQSKVLRVLQEQRFERVGGRETISTDVRIISATNRDLEQMVADGKFRADLYYRLNGFSINLPPLRDRGEDIGVLMQYYLANFNRELGRAVSQIEPEARDLLMRYRWPGNVRQLQTVLRQALLQASGPVLLEDFLPSEVRHASVASLGADLSGSHSDSPLGAYLDEQIRRNTGDLYAVALEHLERQLLGRVMRYTAGNQSQAARLLGITRGSLRNKLRLLRITIDQVVSVAEPDQEPEIEVTADSAD